MDKLYKLVLLLTVLLLSGSVFYYLVIYLPNKTNAEIIRADHTRAKTYCISKYDQLMKDVEVTVNKGIETCWATNICTREQFMAEAKKTYPDFVDWSAPGKREIYIANCIEKYSALGVEK